MQVGTSLQTNNHASTSPLSFLQAGCPSCRPTNSVKALKAKCRSFRGPVILIYLFVVNGYQLFKSTHDLNEETRLDALEMKGLRKILRVSWTANKTNEWVLNKAGIKGELLDTIKARKLAYYGHTMRKQWSCLEKEIMQETKPSARKRGRPRTAWMDNIKTWTGLSVEESIRMTEDRDKCRKYVHGVANPRIEDG